MSLILLVFAFVFACLAAGIPGPVFGRWHLGWLALALYLASIIFGSVSHLVG
jgi:hypothetical protein